VRAQLKNLRMKDGATVLSLALSDSAPLVFPALGRAALADVPLSTEKQSKLKSLRKFLVDYMDHRAQAKYAAMNPTSKLKMMPEQQFSSRWADLNHPCNNGDLIMFVSGGTIDIGGYIRKRRIAKAERRAAREGWV
jgi:hypothetical protein